MASDDLHEFSALYALDALTGEDRARFEEHLEGCDRCRNELAGLRGAASALAFAVQGPLPPTALRGRILDAARVEGQNVVPLRPRRSVAVSAAATLAVAATAAAVAFGVWAASLHSSLNHERAAVRVLGDPSARRVPVSGVRGQLVVAQSGDAVLAVALPAPPQGKTYEAWIANGSVHRAGEFAGRTLALTARVTRGARVLVTLERSGGVDAPTTQPLLSARA
jgi:anti-sigma factor RsiW